MPSLSSLGARLARMRRAVFGRPSRNTPVAEKAWLAEQVRTSSTLAPWRLPSTSSNYTDETPQMRHDYLTYLKESMVKMPFWTKVWSVAAQDLNVPPVDATSETDKKIAAWVKYTTETSWGGKRKCVESVLVPGLLTGWSVSEKVMKVEQSSDWRGFWGLQGLKSKWTRYLEPQVDEFLNVTGIYTTSNNYGQTFDPRDFAIWTYQSLYESPIGISDFRSINRAARFKEAVMKLRMIALDKFSGPWLKGTYKYDEQRKQLMDSLADARASGYIVLSEGADVQVVDLAMSSSSDFQAMIKDLDMEMTVGLRGAHLDMLEGQTAGGRGDTSVQRSVSELVEWALADSWATVWNEQVIPDLVYPNFGPQVRLPRASLGAINSRDIVNDLLVDEALTRLRVPLSIAQLYAKTGREPPKDPADSTASAFGPPPGTPPPEPVSQFTDPK